MILTFLVILLVLSLLGTPVFPYNRSWGWGPGGLLWTVLVILLICWLAGVLR
jgi:hypothetical protein